MEFWNSAPIICSENSANLYTSYSKKDSSIPKGNELDPNEK